MVGGRTRPRVARLTRRQLIDDANALPKGSAGRRFLLDYAELLRTLPTMRPDLALRMIAEPLPRSPVRSAILDLATLSTSNAQAFATLARLAKPESLERKREARLSLFEAFARAIEDSPSEWPRGEINVAVSFMSLVLREPRDRVARAFRRFRQTFNA